MGLPEALRGITDLKSVRNRVQAWYTMLLHPLAEAKNTVEHNIAARERAHSVHMKITLAISAPWLAAESHASQTWQYGAPYRWAATSPTPQRLRGGSSAQVNI